MKPVKGSSSDTNWQLAVRPRQPPSFPGSLSWHAGALAQIIASRPPVLAPGGLGGAVLLPHHDKMLFKASQLLDLKSPLVSGPQIFPLLYRKSRDGFSLLKGEGEVWIGKVWAALNHLRRYKPVLGKRRVKHFTPPNMIEAKKLMLGDTMDFERLHGLLLKALGEYERGYSAKKPSMWKRMYDDLKVTFVSLGDPKKRRWFQAALTPSNSTLCRLALFYHVLQKLIYAAVVTQPPDRRTLEKLWTESLQICDTVWACDL